jgi:hypothetical protein
LGGTFFSIPAFFSNTGYVIFNQKFKFLKKFEFSYYIQMISFLSKFLYWTSNPNNVTLDIDQKVNSVFQNATNNNNNNNLQEEEFKSISELNSPVNSNYIDSIGEFNSEIDNNSKNNNNNNASYKSTNYESIGNIIYQSDSNDENAESYKIGFKFISNSKNRSYYCCIYHIDCKIKRSFHTENGKKLIIRQYGSNHADQIDYEIAIPIKCEEYTFQIENMTSLDAQLYIMNKLRESKLFKEKDIRKYMLTLTQIENMRNRLKLKNNNIINISNNGELIQLINQLIVDTVEKYSLKESHEVIILDKQIGSDKSDQAGLCLGFSFSSKSLIESISDEINKPINKPISLYVDGTWKLLKNRWVLLILSYQVIRRNASKELVQSARPFMFAISYSESECGVSLLINSFIKAGIYYIIL